jgi:hypothetical protein
MPATPEGGSMGQAVRVAMGSLLLSCLVGLT